MARRDGITWLVLGGLVVGLLLLAGCQGGAADGAGAGSEPVPAAPPADADATVGEAAVDEGVAKVEGPKDDAEVGETAEGPVRLALAFEVGQSGTYRVTMATEKSVTWEGNTAQKPAGFKGGHTGNRIEMTFDQQIVETDDEGRAVIEVTIRGLRYRGYVYDKVVLDFDSSSNEDQGSALARLIGQSYRFQMSAKGEVVALLDLDAVRAAVQGDTPSHATAQRLVSDSVIRKRHEIPALMALEAEEVRPQERWSNIRTLTFGMMGAKAYERIYTLAEVQQQDGRQVAVVKMEAIPSAVAAGQLHTSQPVNPFGSMFDSTGTYEGHLKIDLGAGAVTEYVERMDVQWVAADTLGAQEVGSGPAVIKMSATELYELERIE